MNEDDIIPATSRLIRRFVACGKMLGTDSLGWFLQIYVGNLVQGLVTEDALRQLFNSTMKAAFPEQQLPGVDPVVNVSMHSEGRYAFVELRSPEMASAALQLSGQVQLLGQNISVGRPSGYVDPSAAQMAAAQAATAFQAYEVRPLGSATGVGFISLGFMV